MNEDDSNRIALSLESIDGSLRDIADTLTTEGAGTVLGGLIGMRQLLQLISGHDTSPLVEIK